MRVRRRIRRRVLKKGDGMKRTAEIVCFVLTLCLLRISAISETGLSVSVESITDGIDYSTDTHGSGVSEVKVHTVSFNPKESEYMPMFTAGPAGKGISTVSGGRDLIEDGYEVYAGINTLFYMLADKSNYDGYTITDCRLVQATNGYNAVRMLTFDSSGKANIIYSKLGMTLSVNGVKWQHKGYSALGHINKTNKEASDKTSQYESGRTFGMNLVSYFDSSYGESVSFSEAGTVILCKKINGTELMAGCTLKGKIKSIESGKESVNIGDDEFVLYIKDSLTDLIKDAEKLKTGDIISINADEMMSNARTVTRNAVTSMTAQVVLVDSGKFMYARNATVYGFTADSRNRRSALGIKADGMVVMMCSEGSSSTGLTWVELCDYMIGIG